MRWLYVILFAVGTGVYTGLVLCVPTLYGSSFRDIGITYEWWVIFAVIVAVNCKKGWEAALKCFVFFLISQPVIYLVEIVCSQMTFRTACISYCRTWLPMTLFTLPGGFIAYFAKKQNAWGAIVLSIGNTIEGLMAASHIAGAINNFPHHIISAAVSVAAIFVMTFCIQKTKTYRVVTIVLTAVFVAAILIYPIISGRSLY